VQVLFASSLENCGSGSFIRNVMILCTLGQTLSLSLSLFLLVVSQTQESFQATSPGCVLTAQAFGT
jgi:hypothetical protein